VLEFIDNDRLTFQIADCADMRMRNHFVAPDMDSCQSYHGLARVKRREEGRRRVLSKIRLPE
jgi:hypothetical protein